MLHDPVHSKRVRRKQALDKSYSKKHFEEKNSLGNKAINYAIVVYDYVKDTFLYKKPTTGIEPSSKGL